MTNLLSFKSIVQLHSLLLLLIPDLIISSPTGLSCALAWVPSGSGRVPYRKNPISSGTAVYVVRLGVDVVVNGTTPNRDYYCGQLNLSEDSDAFAPTGVTNADVLRSETYSVLSNPLNCSLRWIRVDAHEGPKFPGTTVKVDESKILVPAYVGRGLIDGAARAGTVFAGFSVLHVATEEGVFESKVYDVLTSEQPSLHVTLSNFKFTLNLQQIQSKSRRELFSVDRAENLYNQRTEFHIQAEGRTQEVFVFKENFGWLGVSRVDINMDTWYGAPVMKASDIPVNQDFAKGLGVRLERERIQTTQANFSITNVEKTFACSFREVLEEFPVPFSAEAVIKVDLKSGEKPVSPTQLLTILNQTGRNGFNEQADGSFKGAINGTLDGRFILRTFLMTDITDYAFLDDIGICNVHLATGPIPDPWP